jgi:hypothetical protein
MGDPLANLYGAPIFLFSNHLSQTFFPCFTPPNNKPPIFIAFLSGLSYSIAVKLHDSFLFPAPHVSDDWCQNAIPEALAWEKKMLLF